MKKISALLTALAVSLAALTPNFAAASEISNGTDYPTPSATDKYYVGWLYENYLVNGVSDTYFGAGDDATVSQFVTMMLRVLGYDDSEGDFTYDKAADTALSIGLIDEAIYSHRELSRGDMIIICYNSLETNLKNSKRRLIDNLDV